MSVRNWAISHLPPAVHPALRHLERRATSLAGRVLRQLPFDSTLIGPPRHVAPSLRDLAHMKPYVMRFHPIYPEETLSRHPPRTLEPEGLHYAFTRELLRVGWKAGVATIKNGRVLTSSGAIIAPPDTLIADVSHTGSSDDPTEHPIFRSVSLPPVERIKGRVAVLTMYPANIEGHPFYGHWLFDTLPRLHLLRESGLEWDWLVAPYITEFQKDTLRLLGVNPKIIISERERHIEAEELLVPTLPGLPGNPPSWAVKFLRKSFLTCATHPTRLYISRAKARSRHITNEDALFAALEPMGFQKVFLEDYSFTRQVNLLNSAEFVVSAHSTALANLVFCQPRTKVIEIFSPRYVTVCWWALADLLDLDYGYVLGEGQASGQHEVHDGITVSIPKVLALLSSMGAL